MLNITDSQPPVISNVTIDPASPGYDDTITVSANATDNGLGLKVGLNYSNGTDWTHVKMSRTEGFEYSGSIPPAMQEENLNIYVEAEDRAGLRVNSPAYPVHVGIPDINVMPAAWSVENIAAGRVAEETITIQNPGNSILRVTGIHIPDWISILRNHSRSGGDSTERLTDNVSVSDQPDIASDSQDNLHVVWSDIRGGNYGIYYTMLDPAGEKLINDTLVSSLTMQSRRPAVAVDSGDNVHVVWHAKNGSYTELYYARLNPYLDDRSGDPADISVIKVAGITQLTPDNWDQSHTARIALDSKDNVHIVWEEDDKEIFYMKLDSMGNQLLQEQVSGINGDFWRAEPDIAIDSKDNPHIVWNDPYQLRDYEIIYKMLNGTDGSVLINRTVLTPDDGRNSKRQSIEIDRNDRVYIVWQDQRGSSTEIYFTKLNPYADDMDGSPASERTINLIDDTPLTVNDGIKSNHPWTAIDANGNIHMTWYEQWSGDRGYLHYKLIDSRGRERIKDVQITPARSAATYTSWTQAYLAIDRKGDAHIVWDDYRDGNHEIYHYRKTGLIQIPAGGSLDIVLGADTGMPGAFAGLMNISSNDPDEPLVSINVSINVSEDTVPPKLGNITASPDADWALISWETDEPADSLVEYGNETANYTDSSASTLRVLSHSVNLTGLEGSTTYYYRVTSMDARGNSNVSFEHTFATSGGVQGADISMLGFTDTSLPADANERVYYAQNDTVTFSVDTGTNFTIYGFTTSQIHIIKDGTEITGRVPAVLGFNSTDATYYVRFSEESSNSTYTVYDPLDVTNTISTGLNWTARTNNTDGSFGFVMDERDSAAAVYVLNSSGGYDLGHEIDALDTFRQADSRYGLEAAYYQNMVRNDAGVIDGIIIAQNPDGSWNSNVEDTVFALLALKASGNTSLAVTGAKNRGISWLKSVQNSDGGFAYAGGSSYPLYTAFAAMALKEYGAPEYDAAAAWLWDHMYPDGSWKYTIDTAYGAMALAGSGYDISKPAGFLKQNPVTDPYIKAIGIRALSLSGETTDAMLDGLYADRTLLTGTWGTMPLEKRMITTSAALEAFNNTEYTAHRDAAESFLRNVSAPSLRSRLHAAAALQDTSTLAGILPFQNRDGGFAELYHESNVRDSSMAYMALSGSGYEAQKDALAAYLAGRQNESGSFGTVEETALAVIALYMSGNASYSGNVNGGLEYLRSLQDADGSWNSNNYSTAIALEALVKAGNDSYDNNITKSAGYLVYVQNSGGSWALEYPDTLTTARVMSTLKYIRPSYVTGDFTGDDIVDFRDAIYLAKHYYRFRGYEDLRSPADFTRDGVVDFKDVVYLVKHYYGFPGYEELNPL